MRSESLPRVATSDSVPSARAAAPSLPPRKAKLRRASAATVEAIESRVMLSASLLKDINTTLTDANPQNFVTSNGELYFNTVSASGATQLWQTNGTAAGTVLATSLVPGAPQATMSDLTDVNGTVYFFAQGPTDGNLVGLYKSNGTVAGTTEIAKLNAPSNLISGNGTLYFTTAAPQGQSGRELWKSDGTPGGTVALTNLPTDYLLTDADGTLYFVDNGALWKSDGTAAGTGEVASVSNFAGVSNPNAMVAVNNRIFLLNSGELWTSDGTAAGTIAIQQAPTGIVAMINYQGELYFTTHSLKDQLWKSDGTGAGTVMVDQTTVNGFDDNPGTMAIANNTLYFNLSDSTHGEELWRSDGTSQGTAMVADVNPGPGDGIYVARASNFDQPVIGGIGVLNGEVYFAGTDVTHGVQLWQSNGTAAGTSQLYQFTTTNNGSNPSPAITLGNITYFTADDGVHGDELWKTDGTAAGTAMVADLTPGAVGSYPEDFVNFNGTLYFVAAGDVWKTDGTAAGTVIVQQGRFSGDLTQVGNSLYFTSYDSSFNVDLFRSDGTAAGTAFVETLVYDSPAPEQNGYALAVMGGSLYVMDGGTLSRVNPNGTSTNIGSYGLPFVYGNLVAVNNTLYFAAPNPSSQNVLALWKSDGTTAGTSMVWSSNATTDGLYGFSDFTAFGNEVAFVINQPASQTATVYASDGTAAGTYGLTGGQFADFTPDGNYLYFTANVTGQSGGQTLYVTDGRATKGFGFALKSVYGLMPVNNLMYFVATGSNGPQLWETDGPTVALADPTETASGWSATSVLGQADGKLFFGASDPQHGSELWSLPLAPTATASFIKSDSATSGNWTGTYGSDGYAIMGGATSLPGYVTMQISSQNYVWAPAGQADGRAPQVAAGSTQHEAGCAYAASTATVDLNFTDGLTHQVAFYLLDYDRQGRVETVQVTNGDSGQVLDARTITNFAGGQYLVYTLSGHVKINFINAGPLNAVVSAILFDPNGPGSQANTTSNYAGVDHTTQGQWTGIYGSEGYDVIGGSENLPSYANMSISNAQFYVWNGSTTDPRALQSSPGSSTGVAACDYSNSSSFTINLDLTDGKLHQVALYFVDYDHQNRSEMVQISDAVTGAVFSSSTVQMFGFSGGEYFRWDLSGNVKITISNLGGLNEVVSGIFFDPGPAASASFVATDSTTQGNYTGVYGQNGYNLLALTGGGAPYSSLTPAPGVQQYEWNSDTTETRVLQYPGGSSQRIAACWYSNAPSMSFNLDLTDGNTHRVAFYFLDYDYQNRAESIQISNAVTGAVLDTESVSNFSQGKYLVWNLSGDLNFTITKTGGLNEVISGIFFG